MNIDYINDMYWLIMSLSHYSRHNNKTISESTIDEMLSLTIDLLELLEQYKNDQYDY